MKLRNIIHTIIGLILLIITIISCSMEPNSEVMLKLFNIKTTNQLYINIPGPAKQQCLINEVTQNDALSYAEGINVDEETGEKLKVIVDAPKIITLNNRPTGVTRFVVPFSVSGQGTGNFNYLGLFELDQPSNNISHKDSYLLGDRIMVEGMEYDNADKLKLTLKTHTPEQAMAEEPKAIKIIHFVIDEMITPVEK